MADAKKGNFLTKKVGPLPVWGYAAVGGGVFLVLRYVEARKSAAAATAATGTNAGTGITVPTGDTDNGSTSTGTTTPTFSSIEAWEQAAIAAMASTGSIDPATALNGLTDWISGQCVTSAQYSAIASVINNPAIGLPPGFSSVPVLSVCSGAPTTPVTPPSTGTSTTGTTYATGTSTLSGSGFGVPGGITNIADQILGSDGHSYIYLQSPAQQSALVASGGTVYYQVAQGIFEPITPADKGKLAAGTPTFARYS